MAFGAACIALALGAVAGCGGSIEHGGPAVDAGSGQGGSSAQAGAGRGGSSSGRGGGGAASAGTGQGGRVIVDPEPVDTGCPEQDPLPPDNRCDPFTAGSCAAGLACYPYVDHPEGDGCEQQRYGTVCAPSGAGVQGDLCGDEAGGCAPGFVCVVGQRPGKRCAALCRIGQPNACSGGLLCGDLDVSGFGACG